MTSGALEKEKACNLCPRQCRVDRNGGAKGICGETSTIRAARAALHKWEEPCISGTRGSGTVFFTGCNLKCVFCQNGNISGGAVGNEITVDRLSDIFMELFDKGANNINLVTPTHFIPGVAKAIEKARKKGLEIPIVYNCGGYEAIQGLKILDGLVDVYLPDMKYFSPEMSLKYSGAPDYFDRACESFDEMFRQVGNPVFSDGSGPCEKGIMTKGMIARHLLLPGGLEDSKKVIAYLYNRFKDNIYISIMNQYTPMKSVTDAGSPYPELGRKVTDEEYDALVDFAIDIGIENGFIQEGNTADDSFIPDFDMEGI